MSCAVLALADDLTGALETGARFAALGIPAVVTTRPEPAPGWPVTVIDTETRHLPPEDAAALIAAVPLSGARLVYKKTDSTLRGNIAAELCALSRQMPEARIAYLPAYPALGRTVRNGHLYVDGVPVHETAFGRDALNPVAGSSVAAMLGGDLPCTVYDSETGAELAAATALALADPRCRILAGPASVAAEIATQLDEARHPPAPWPRVERCLVINGSRHEISARQVAYALDRGAVSDAPEAPWRVLPSAACPDMHPLEVAAETGELVCACLDAAPFDALMVFGGDTAFGILEALGRPLLEPLGEIVTGVPVSRIAGRSLYLISKAGGFGDEALICRVRELLQP
jgi:D-threonate/D-erythronate kinase